MQKQQDHDVATWSNDGRLQQIEYAMNAMNNGSCTIGLKSNNGAVLVTQNRAASELAYPQNKIFMLNDNQCAAISGINNDGRTLIKFLRDIIEKHYQQFDSEMPFEILINELSIKMHARTYQQGDRPQGVGLLIAGLDKRLNKQRVFGVFPNGENHEFISQSVGSRSQSARTYFEKNFETQSTKQSNELVKEGLGALKSSKYGEDKYGPDYVSIVIVDSNGTRECNNTEKEVLLKDIGLI